MSEIYWDILMSVIYVLEGLCVDLLFGKFADIRTEKYFFLKHGAGIAWALYEIICYFAFVNRYGTELVINIVITLAFMLVLSVLLNKGDILCRIFPVIIFISVRELSVLASNCLTGTISFLTDPLLDMVNNGIIYPEYASIALTAVNYAFFAAVGFIRTAVIYIVIKMLIKNCRYERRRRSGILICTIPAIAGIIAAALIKMILVTIEDGYTVLLYSRYPLLYFIIPALSVTLISSVVLTFRQCQNVEEMQLENAEKIILENQIAQMQNTISETEQLYDNIRSFRHDIKNNMAVMQSLLEKKCPEDEEIKQYVEEMSLSVQELDSRVHTGNAVCDSVINGKFCYAENIISGIKLDGNDFLFSNIAGIKSYDVGIILNNGLDNAIEACLKMKKEYPEKEAFITVSSFRKRNMFFIEIENSFDGFLMKDNDTDRLISLKEDPELHGIGLRNIRKCAEKYSGGVEHIVSGNVFTLTVMIKEENYVNENR